MPRPDKRSSLTLLTNERLRALAEGFELSPKRSLRHDELVELLASSKRASFESVLGVLKRAELKEVCRHHGLDDGGKAKEELVARILGGGRGRTDGGQTALPLEGDAEAQVDAEGFKTSKKQSRKAERSERVADVAAPTAAGAPEGPGEEAVLTSMSTNSDRVSFIWSVAELLRGDYKQSEYGRVVLPLTVLRRLDQVLAPTRDAVRKAAHKHADAAPALRERNVGEFINGFRPTRATSSRRMPLASPPRQPGTICSNPMLHGFTVMQRWTQRESWS